MMRRTVVAVLFARCAGIESPQACPLQKSGINIHVHPGGSTALLSDTLPGLPASAITKNHGPSSNCGFDGTIVLGGPLSLREGSRWYAYSAMIRRSLTIFLDWLNGRRGGVRFGGKRYAMRFVWVDDASSTDQVTNATVYATRATNADFAFGGVLERAHAVRFAAECCRRAPDAVGGRCQHFRLHAERPHVRFLATRFDLP